MIFNIPTIKMNKIYLFISALFKVIQFLPSIIKNKLIALIFIIPMGTFLDLCGIGLLFPLITSLLKSTEGETLQQNKYLTFFSFETNNLFIIYLAAFIVILFIVKTIFMVFIISRQSSIIHEIKHYISNSLFEKYCNLNFEYHIENNSNELIKNVIIETQNIIEKILNPVINLYSESFLFVFFVGSLFFIDIKGALIVFLTIAISILSFFKVVKKYLKLWGEKRLNLESQRTKLTTETFYSIKDVKLSKTEDKFISDFKSLNNNFSKIETKQYTLSQIPRLFLETIGVIGLMALIFFELNIGKSTFEIIPIIAVFGAISFKLIPSANKIIYSIQTLKYSEPLIKLIFKDLNHLQDVNLKVNNINIDSFRSLEFMNVSYTYPGSKKKSLANINLKFKSGDYIGIVGKSGSGKTTLVDIISGILQPLEGTILINNIDVTNNSDTRLELISYVQQNIILIDDTLIKNIAFGQLDDDIDIIRLNKVVEMAQLKALINELPLGLNTFVGDKGIKLSGGQKQRIAIARALYRKTPIIIFDEATSSLDKITENDIFKSIDILKNECTLIVVSHNNNNLDEFSILFEVKDGNISVLRGN